eukprot:CAMPEP_0202905624 /NCGR_PEP_ID=MMETSP1392-20130828/35318_1 /ASSEMBLY_ACC=CAM_ASM_000868 /TAXON_ID=225041 /ORGANISM="Chlamydomonas chlamydogama, Strain SAG 11-48b" /LENGTH=78 /DNA_ID=CAMNT_0049593819 /DNA_START=680 /DNA_END=913 /DNA_ORIENTATION=+
MPEGPEDSSALAVVARRISPGFTPARSALPLGVTCATRTWPLCSSNTNPRGFFSDAVTILEWPATATLTDHSEPSSGW